jgi:hypothetical protein
VEALGDDRLWRRAGERRFAGQHLVQHRAEGVDVGSRVHRLAARLLGAHVGGCADRHARLGEPLAGLVARERAADAEVGDQRVAVGEQDVLRLHIAVDDAVAVGEIEPVGHLARDS